MEKLEYTVRQTICRYHMLQPGDQVVIALSGGADSVCLLSLLADMREEMGLKLRSLHVHHGLRGEEADRDGDFSIKISEALGVPCHMIKAEVKKYASQTGMSEEEAGRILRYKALEEEAGAWEGENGQTVKIAVAHHSMGSGGDHTFKPVSGQRSWRFKRDPLCERSYYTPYVGCFQRRYHPLS